jgi:diguanylate cyclase (GGDEF)-like protein
MFKPGDECGEILKVVKNTLLADSVNLFIGSDGSLRLKCSTEETDRVIPSDGGIIAHCFKEKKPFLSSDVAEKKLDVGYLKKEKISSLAVVPVLDEEFPLGVLSADSARFQAFSRADQDTLEIFARQVARILQRERMFPQIRRSFDYLKILHEESATLLSSLDMEIIVQNLMEGARKIAPSEAIFLIAEGGEFRIFPGNEAEPAEKKLVNIRGTLVDVVVKNRHQIYISDLRNYRSPLLPFKTGAVASAFLLPLIYEKEILGVLLLLMDKIHPLHSRQTELLEVLGNQTATSMINARFHAEIEKLAVTDGLTGLFNHRHFQERVAEELSRLQRFSNPLSLLMLDIDYFKKINDTYGHPVGDSVLKEVARIIKKTIRNIDVAARYGGEEFAVILIETGAKGAMKMAERLRKTILNARFSSEKKEFSITVSIGISTFPEGGTHKEDLIENADNALYHAKDSGRNQSVFWKDINAMKRT